MFLFFNILFFCSQNPIPQKVDDKQTSLYLSQHTLREQLALPADSHLLVKFWSAKDPIIVSFYREDGTLLKKATQPSSYGKQFIFSEEITTKGNYYFEIAMLNPKKTNEETEISIEIFDIHASNTCKEAHSGYYQNQITKVSKDIVEVKTINGYDFNFDDLHFLKEILKEKRIVMLGEQTHLDAEATEAKIRLVTYLNKELGYDHLFFESSIFAMHKLQEKIDCKTIERQDFYKHIYLGWTNTEEAQALYDYFINPENASTNLRLYGFDNQFYNPPSFEFLKNDLVNYLKTINFPVTNEFEAFWVIFEKAQKYVYYYKKEAPPKEEALTAFYAFFDKIRSHITNVRDQTKHDLFWLQVIKSMRTNAEDNIHQGSDKNARKREENKRSLQMAENFLTLFDMLPKGEKVIIWAANRHIAKDLSTIKGLDDETPYSELEPFAGHISKKHSNLVYAIGFTALEGAYGHPQFIQPLDNSWYTTVISPKQSTLFEIENAFDHTGYNYAFLDLSGHQYLKSISYVSRPMGHVSLNAPWHHVFDGLFYTRKLNMVTPFGEKQPD